MGKEANSIDNFLWPRGCAAHRRCAEREDKEVGQAVEAGGARRAKGSQRQHTQLPLALARSSYPVK